MLAGVRCVQALVPHAGYSLLVNSPLIAPTRISAFVSRALEAVHLQVTGDPVSLP